MNLLWRFIYILLFSRFNTPTQFMHEGSTRFRVLPTDIDVLLHLNNGRYFSLMDLARINFMIRNGIFAKLKKHHIYPVVASEMIRFKKSLPLFSAFAITTQLLGWDNKFFYIRHTVKRHGEIYAFALMKACFLTKNGTAITTADVLHYADITENSPPLPSWVHTWMDAEQTFYHETLGK